jgi:sugar O-acyltransferase (sialic acid O-acetyltransferase NeuD family)
MIGGGGHASVIADILLRQKRDIVAVVSPDDLSLRKVFSDIPQIRQDEDVTKFSQKDVKLVMGIGILPKSSVRERVSTYFLELGYHFESVIADSVRLSPFAELDDGVQLLENVVVQAGSKIGALSIVNTGVVVEHDCRIGAHNHIAPMATLCGQVTTGKGVYIGANATVIQSLELGDNVIVGAGAIVTQSLGAHSISHPARGIVKPY